ncbi:hypothetical protein P3U27_11490 [Staphylococcus pseudintermedius]|uniref:hypothetical protein n=1 Tax=Staphylococcus pseudintermedius TaxID=283734 RepID=UPI002B25FA4E|nr:hypothetical protein [Staphylococcus pseudintermedius]WQL14958.1 hypothetical protein P3U27_11490 [Staphylococcus pseudintermedius]
MYWIIINSNTEKIPEHLLDNKDYIPVLINNNFQKENICLISEFMNVNLIELKDYIPLKGTVNNNLCCSNNKSHILTIKNSSVALLGKIYAYNNQSYYYEFDSIEKLDFFISSIDKDNFFVILENISVEQILNIQNKYPNKNIGFSYGTLEEVSLTLAKLITEYKYPLEHNLNVDMIDLSKKNKLLLGNKINVIKKHKDVYYDFLNHIRESYCSVALTLHGNGNFMYLNNKKLGNNLFDYNLQNIKSSNIFINSCFSHKSEITSPLIFSIAKSLMFYAGYKENSYIEGYWYLSLIELNYSLGEIKNIISHNLNKRNICSGEYFLMGDPTNNPQQNIKNNYFTQSVNNIENFSIDFSKSNYCICYFETPIQNTNIFYCKNEVTWILLNEKKVLFINLEEKNHNIVHVKSIDIYEALKHDFENLELLNVIKVSPGIKNEYNSLRNNIYNNYYEALFKTNNAYNIAKSLDRMSEISDEILTSSLKKFIRKRNSSHSPLLEDYRNLFFLESEFMSETNNNFKIQYYKSIKNVHYQRKIRSCIDHGIVSDEPFTAKNFELDIKKINDKIILTVKNNSSTKKLILGAYVVEGNEILTKINSKDRKKFTFTCNEACISLLKVYIISNKDLYYYSF